LGGEESQWEGGDLGRIWKVWKGRKRAIGSRIVSRRISTDLKKSRGDLGSGKSVRLFKVETWTGKLTLDGNNIWNSNNNQTMREERSKSQPSDQSSSFEKFFQKVEKRITGHAALRPFLGRGFTGG